MRCGITDCIVRDHPLLQLETEFLEDRAVAALVVRVAGGIMAEHALALVLSNGPKMVDEGLGPKGFICILAIYKRGTRCICQCIPYHLTILANRAKEWVLVKVDALVHDCLEACFGQMMMA